MWVNNSVANFTRNLHQMDATYNLDVKCNPSITFVYIGLKFNPCTKIDNTGLHLNLFNSKFTIDFKLNLSLLRHKSIRWFFIDNKKNIKYTVFYQNFGFPYLFNTKVVCFRTCSDTLVPTYNYPLWVILVQLFYLR